MSSQTEARLASYLAAELAILHAQEVRGGDSSHRMADLREVRDQIDKLQRQLRRGGLQYSLANLAG